MKNFGDRIIYPSECSMRCKPTAAKAPAKDSSEESLPKLNGVSLRQIGFGVACRKAAIASNAVAQEVLQSESNSSYWIDNYKHLLGR